MIDERSRMTGDETSIQEMRRCATPVQQRPGCWIIVFALWFSLAPRRLDHLDGRAPGQGYSLLRPDLVLGFACTPGPLPQ